MRNGGEITGMTANNESDNDKIHRVVVSILALVTGVIAAALTLLFVILVARTYGTNADVTVLAILLSMTGSFALFFTVVAFQAITSAVRPRPELMTLTGWRVIAGALAITALVCGVLYHWIAILVPMSLALVCLSRDSKVREWLQALGSQ